MSRRYEALTLYLVLHAVIGGGGTALRDFVSDAVGNATQDANYKGLYLPFYTVGTGVGKIPGTCKASRHMGIEVSLTMQVGCQTFVERSRMLDP